MIITVRRDPLNDKVAASLGINLKTDTVRFFLPEAEKTKDKHLYVSDILIEDPREILIPIPNLLQYSGPPEFRPLDKI